MEQKNMLPGLTREAEEQKLQEIIGIAQQNLERARADIRKVNEDLEDLLDVYEAQDKEGLALWNNATARLKENEYDLVRYEKARRKPYFGRIDFKDPNVKGDESYYIGRVGIAKITWNRSYWTGEHRLHRYIMRVVWDHVSIPSVRREPLRLT